MSNIVLEIENLSKIYKSQPALNHVNLQLKQGRIYGLIGKNGAGKTTLMRMVAGLAFPTEGSMKLFGKSSRKELEAAGKRIGALIEAPALVAGMTAKENMHLQCLMRGFPNYEAEDEFLELVGLNSVGKKKVRNFSLGMKQRLGIAATLMGNPELLMLDEPINGLDPQGVIEIRNLLKKLSKYENKTILISSHNLPELYQTATDYIIIHEGEIKEIISHEELDERCKSYISLESTDTNQLTRVLEEKLKTSNFKVISDYSVKLYDLLDERERIGRVLYENGVIITQFAEVRTSLEEYFMSVIGGSEDA
ncbi:MAG: ATP-binding cassette domain-containing protein [Lachnospiraceae bacterium]|nr:ATP-binding cassette domain-containing protein [Lachnospiraceae bacterium]